MARCAARMRTVADRMQRPGASSRTCERRSITIGERACARRSSRWCCPRRRRRASDGSHGRKRRPYYGPLGITARCRKGSPSIPLPPELLAHLRRWKRRGQRFAVEWHGEPVTKIAKAFRAVVKDAGLDPDVTPHVLRHTAATWLMQAGTDPWEAAGFLGMTVETLLSRYGHHHPDYLSGARGPFSRHRNRHRNAATEREQTVSNVTKIADFSKGAG